ncbi:MAG: cytochrome c oxidase subunit 2, partial [Candidatus Azotimanducaceae bacterium]
ACHGLSGEGNVALNSPKISGQHHWYLEQQIRNFKQGIRGSHKDDTYGQQMAPMAGMLVNDTAIRDISAYISSLPKISISEKLSANVAHGKKLYVTCATCHGKAGEGKYAMNAPQLSGQESWYMIRQLQNFKTGVRGRHALDLFGPQMSSMSRYLRSENDIKDVVAYINTLPLQDLETHSRVKTEFMPSPVAGGL